MTFKVVQLRLITWEELPLMKSDIGWVYTTHSKVFIPSSHIQCFVFIDITLNVLITMIDTCLSTQYYKYIIYLICSVLHTVMCLYSIPSYYHLISHCFYSVILPYLIIIYMFTTLLLPLLYIILYCTTLLYRWMHSYWRFGLRYTSGEDTILRM